MKSPRLIAFETLYKIFYDSSYSNIALDKALSDVNQNKAFISALVYGVVERKLTLDYFINKYAKSKPKPKVLIILRMGVYQLLFMDKVHSGAAINESINLAKEIKQDYYSKLINAVLHKIDNDRQIPDDLSIKYSIPENLIKMWTKQYGIENVETFLPCINNKPPVFAVANKLLTAPNALLDVLKNEGVSAEMNNGLIQLTSQFDLSKLNSFKNGLFHIEDMSSYECAKNLDAKPGDTVLDICSAPGGKAFTIAEFMQNCGEVFCFDLHRHRLNLINDGAKRLNINIIKTAVNDGAVFNSQLPSADKILCDVPCSGFGIIRRKPEIRYKELDSVKNLPEIQLSILSVSSKYLKIGGRIIYSTCTLNKKENEKVVRAFLADNGNFKLIKEITTFPTVNGGDGFYMALMEKTNEN